MTGPTAATAGTRAHDLGPGQTWRILLFANGCSLVGNYVQNLALPLWVLSVTGSYTATGITFAVGTLPVVVCAPLAGRVVDRFDRRRVFIVCELVCAALVVALVLAVRAENLVVVYLVVALLKAVGSASIPAVQAMLKERLAGDAIRPVIALFEIVFGATMSLGPLVGATLSAGIGIEAALWVNLASFAVAGLAGMTLRPVAGRSPDGADGAPARLAPLRWRGIDRRLRRVGVAEAGYFLFLGAEVVIALAVFQERVGIAAAAVYQTCAGLGWILGSALFVRRSTRPPVTLWAGAVVSSVAAAALVVDGRSWGWVAVVVVGLLGGAGNVMIAGAATVEYQTLTDNDVIGRVFAFRRALVNLLMTGSYVTVPFLADVSGQPALVLLAAGLVNLVTTTALVRPYLGRGRA